MAGVASVCSFERHDCTCCCANVVDRMHVCVWVRLCGRCFWKLAALQGSVRHRVVNSVLKVNKSAMRRVNKVQITDRGYLATKVLVSARCALCTMSYICV